MADVLMSRRCRIWRSAAPLLGATALSFSIGCASVPTGASFADLHYPQSPSFLDIDGIRVAYIDQGRGPKTLILIHGLGSSLPAWSRNLPALAERARVVAIDLPGYGKSSKANYLYSMNFFARVVERAIVSLKLEHVVLVGHSMGGQIAITHGLLYPLRAEALVLVAPAGLERFEPGEGAWLGETVSKEFVTLTSLEGVYYNLVATFNDPPPEAEFMLADRLRIIGGPDFDDYAYAISRSVYAMIHEPVWKRLPEIQKPVLIIFGSEDGLIPNPILHGGETRAVVETAAPRFPKAETVLIPHAGHMVQFERPAEWNAAVSSFLDRLPGGTK